MLKISNRKLIFYLMAFLVLGLISVFASEGQLVSGGGGVIACSITTCPSNQVNVQTGQTADGCPIYVCKPIECLTTECPEIGDAGIPPCPDGTASPKFSCLRQTDGTCSWKLTTRCPTVCGNGICEEGEAGGCPSVGQGPCWSGTCPQDCKTTCFDSDSGKNYYTKGYVVWGTNGANLVDYCSGDQLVEWYCGQDNVGYSEYFTCPNGCKDGSCLKCPPQPYGLPYNCPIVLCLQGVESVQDPTTCCYVCKNKPTCGNGVCETGEADEFACTASIPGTCGTINGTCPKDCKPECKQDSDCPSFVCFDDGRCLKNSCIKGKCISSCPAGDLKTRCSPMDGFCCKLPECTGIDTDCKKEPVCGDGVCDEAEQAKCQPCGPQDTNCGCKSCPQDCSKKRCPAVECPTPPEGCSYSCGRDENGCMTCGNIVCKSCPIPECAAPPQGCTYDGNARVDNNGCKVGCGNIVCAIETNRSTETQGAPSNSDEGVSTRKSWICSHFRVFC